MSSALLFLPFQTPKNDFASDFHNFGLQTFMEFDQCGFCSPLFLLSSQKERSRNHGFCQVLHFVGVCSLRLLTPRIHQKAHVWHLILALESSFRSMYVEFSRLAPLFCLPTTVAGFHDFLFTKRPGEYKMSSAPLPLLFVFKT
jgi:hypothetical protein